MTNPESLPPDYKGMPCDLCGEWAHLLFLYTSHPQYVGLGIGRRFCEECYEKKAGHKP